MTTTTHPRAMYAVLVCAMAMPFYFAAGLVAYAFSLYFTAGAFLGSAAASLILLITIIVVAAREGWLDE